MSRMRHYRCLIFVFLFLYSDVFSQTNSSFNGRWEYIEYVPGEKKPYSVFDISLSEIDEGDINGAYCFVTHFVT
jgi:hypothetical protein